jgi:hypothetical protein
MSAVVVSPDADFAGYANDGLTRISAMRALVSLPLAHTGENDQTGNGANNQTSFLLMPVLN